MSALIRVIVSAAELFIAHNLCYNFVKYSKTRYLCLNITAQSDVHYEGGDGKKNSFPGADIVFGTLHEGFLSKLGPLFDH